jgi:Asp-tRNA(Asn)/Glu-tRNA(Gln) amidotransferase A subunit family amidase
MSDLTQFTATQLLDLYRQGKASPVEVTQAVLQRIARMKPLPWPVRDTAKADGKRTVKVARPCCPWTACRCPSKT